MSSTLAVRLTAVVALGLALACKRGGNPPPTTTTTTATTSTTKTTTTTVPVTTTSTVVTTTTSTTATTLCNCCTGSFGKLAFTTSAPSSLVIGALKNPSGTSVLSMTSGRLYMGGAGVGIPAWPVPDLATSFMKIVSCNPTMGTFQLGPTTAAETGSNRTCTDPTVPNPEYPGKPGCLFGPPVPGPNPSSPSTSKCAVYRVGSNAFGTASCNAGSMTGTLGILLADIYLTGDLLPGVPGVQPCPLCTGGACQGGPNDGLPCTPGSSALGDDYPTSHDCPPPDFQYVATIGTRIDMTTGSAQKVSADLPGQDRVFCGFCTTAFGTTFEGPPSVPCTSNAQCTNPSFAACKQRNPGAFGIGDARTITETGFPAGVCLGDGGPHPARLASVFCLPSSYNATIDSVGDLPGPGAITLPGAMQLVP